MTRANVVADHAALVGGPRTWVRTLLRTRSVTGRAILAHLASTGRLDAEALESLPHRPDRQELLAQLDPRTAGAYARVLAHQPGPPEQEVAAMDLLALLLGADSAQRPADADIALYGQLLAKHRRRTELANLLGRRDLVARLPVDVVASLRADLANPFVGSATAEAEFLALFNEVIDPSGPRAVRLRDAGHTAFDRLEGAAVGTEHGPLISVVTSSFNPDHALLVAARSLVEQIWASWEMLVVDDASTDPSAAAILAEVERLDPRIRVIRKSVNGGTYRARNTALRRVRGSFVTFLDSDDWAHPERLAAGVRPMLEQPGIVATRTHGTRVTEELELTRPGYPPHFETASSLMFRFPDVPARIGFFDPARKAADTEYIRRIEAAYGRPVHDLPGRALTLLRRTDDSLSAADFSFGWRHPSRWAYKQSYGLAHREIVAGGDPFTEPEGGSPHFGAHRWARPGDPGRPATRHFDVVFAGDWRRFGGPQVSMMEEITALRAHGLRIGVLHLEAMRFRSAQDEPLCEPLLARLSAGEVELVLLDDDATVDLMVLRYPPILQFPPATERALRPRRLLIMANQAPAEPDGSDQRYVPADVHRNAVGLFGVEPLWVPQGPTIRRVLADLLPAEAISRWDNQGIIDAEQWYTQREPLPLTGRLVVGRYSRDSAIKFPPELPDLLAGYGFAPDIDVRFMGATKTMERMFEDGDREVPGSWTVLPERTMPPKDFLDALDVVVYLDDPNAHEAFGRVLLESAASGALVVAAPKHEPTFGDALLYAEPSEVVALVERLRADPEQVARQRELTRRRVRERWSHASFVDRVHAELTAVQRPAPLGPATQVPEDAQVRLWRPSIRSPLLVESATGVGVRHAPLRRLADGEIADAVAVLHAVGCEEDAADLLTDIRAAHRPGEPAVDLPAGVGTLPDGVCAVVQHVDGEWHCRTTPGWAWRAEGRSCRLVRRAEGEPPP